MVTCPQCKAEYGTPRIITQTEKINEHGNLQFDFDVETECYIKYNAEKKTYSCSRCGHEFTFREAVLQAP